MSRHELMDFGVIFMGDIIAMINICLHPASDEGHGRLRNSCVMMACGLTGSWAI